jgi:hypothetical protein
MSDNWDDDEDTDDEAPSLKTEEGRDAWIEFLLSEKEEGEDEWAQAQVVREDDDMVARFRWPDGREEVYDMQIRRSMEVVRPAGAEGSN